MKKYFLKLNKNLILFSSCLVIFICTIFLFVQNARALVEGSLGALPSHFDPNNPKTKSWFIYELKPEETKEDSITVVNNTENPIEVKVYAVDATTTSDGGFALLNENQRQTDVGSWVQVSKDIISVKPRDRVEVPFTITIPKYATVGDHGGGIIVQEVKQAAGPSGGMSLNIVSRVGTRIYETVPGDQVIDLKLSNLIHGLKDGHLTFSFTMENKGNIFLNPKGTLEIKNSQSKSVDRVQLETLGTVIPGKPTTVTIDSKATPPVLGKYTATVTVDYTTSKAASISTSFYIYNPKIDAPAAGVLLLSPVVLFGLKKFRKRKVKKETPENVEIPELTFAKEQNDIKTPSVAYTKALLKEDVQVHLDEKSIDTLFISHHVKLIGGIVLASILILSILFAFVLQYFVLGKFTPTSLASFTKRTEAPTPIPAELATIAPSPTYMPVDRSSMKVIVLNGTKTVGLAKSIGNILVQKGFIVSKTGNADAPSVGTVISYPQGKMDGAIQLQKELTVTFANIKVEVSTDSSDFFIITLGQ